MPRSKDTAQLSFDLSQQQIEAIRKAAGDTPIGRYMRGLLALHVPDFPPDGTQGGLTPQGKHKRIKPE